jgi:hypothetical protein
MGRTIITKRDTEKIQAKDITLPGQKEPAAEEVKVDDYSTRLLKYIPAEVVAIYVFIDSIIKQSAAPDAGLMWIVFVVMVILTALYIWRVQKVEKWAQVLICTLAFAVWVFSLGGPFALLAWYKPIYGAVLLPLFTFAVGVIEPRG